MGSSNIYDNIKEFIPNVKLSDTNLWKFCELAESIYTLKKSAELFHRGGIHFVYNTNYKEIMQNKERYGYINYVIIPTLIDELYKVLLNETDNIARFVALDYDFAAFFPLVKSTSCQAA